MYIKIVLNVFMIIQQGCSRDILPRYRILSQKEEKKPGKFYKKNTKNKKSMQKSTKLQQKIRKYKKLQKTLTKDNKTT